jgi:hypothetical protein
METINEALGLSEEWRSIADKKIENLIDEEAHVSGVMEKMIAFLKEAEFGEGEYEISAYEKKLTYMGFMILSEMMAREKAAEKLETLLALLGGKRAMDKDDE